MCSKTKQIKFFINKSIELYVFQKFNETSFNNKISYVIAKLQCSLGLNKKALQSNRDCDWTKFFAFQRKGFVIYTISCINSCKHTHTLSTKHNWLIIFCFTLKLLHLCRDVTIASEGHVRRFGSLSRKGFLSCHTCVRSYSNPQPHGTFICNNLCVCKRKMFVLRKFR